MTKLTFTESKSRYDAWLTKQLGAGLVVADLATKGKLLRESPFVFLRGTYWRWAETILVVCPEFSNAPEVLGVGDIHLENFGTWRDADGRLIWGVNDFDEAASMPYALDLVRLATSAALAEDIRKVSIGDICQAILEGYRAGLAKPGAIVLDQDWHWLRNDVVVPEERRVKFWKNIAAAKPSPAPQNFRTALAQAMPEAGLSFRTTRRVAGTGSLGRPRWMAVADWRGGTIVREAKALVMSGWLYGQGKRQAATRAGEIAQADFRAPDPWYHVSGGIVVRRLSPNNRKIEVEKRATFLMKPEMHAVMGEELASIHLGTAGARARITRDLAKRKPRWLESAAERAADAVKGEYKQWRKA